MCATFTRRVATCFLRTRMRFSSCFLVIFLRAAREVPSCFRSSSAPMQAASCFLLPVSLASQTEALTRVAAAIFSQICRPLFLFLYLFQVLRRREYERLRLRSCFLYRVSIDLATCSQILRPLAMDLA